MSAGPVRPGRPGVGPFIRGSQQGPVVWGSSSRVDGGLVRGAIATRVGLKRRARSWIPDFTTRSDDHFSNTATLSDCENNGVRLLGAVLAAQPNSVYATKSKECGTAAP
jgi:hypothetical protein